MANKLPLALVVVAQVLIAAAAAGEILQIEVNGESGNDTEDCLSGEEPCATLDYALNGTSSSVSSVHYLLAPDVPHELRSNYTFYHKSDIGISSLDGSRAYIECIGNNTGLSFDHSQNLSFRDVTFNHCGSPHVTTSSDFSKSNDTSNYTAYLYANITLFFIFCRDVTFDGVVVNGSTGTGVVFYSTVGNNVISNSSFTYNRPVEDKPGGGGVAVEYIYCIPGDSSCSENSGNSFNSTVYSNGSLFTFQLCNFSNNEANTSSITGDSFIVPHANTNVALGRGAGLSLLHKGSIMNSSIIVDNCTFTHNEAVWGGAMLIEFQDTSRENEVNITNCYFYRNKCSFNSCNYAGTGGGGVRVQFASFHDHVIENKVRFINVTFHKNHAYFGGGLSFFTFPTYRDRSYSNDLFFYNCTWNRNIARLGSAIDLSLWNINGFSDGSLVVSPYFEESTFVNNTVKYTKFYGTPTGIGAVYTDSVPLNFTGSNTFLGNFGSALVALDATVEFRNNSQTYFEGNEGLSGGAMTLFSKAFLLFGDNCHTTFRNNNATLHGGAISWQSVGDHQLISSRNCFIRYYNTSADPTEWNVMFNFDGNNAGFSGDAIFATSLLGCLWGGKSYGNLYNDMKNEYLTVFCWNNKTNIWNYNSECNSTNSTNLIATAPAYYFNEANGTVQCGKYDWYNISVVPGKPTKLDDVMMLDDRQNKIHQDSVVYMYMYTTISNETKKSDTMYVTNEALPYNITIANETIHLGTIIPRVMATTVNLSFTPCPPGFSNEHHGDSCKRGSLPFVKIYSNFTADIQFGYWIGKIDDDDSRYYVGECYFCPWNITIKNGSRLIRQNYIHLPEDGTPLDSFLCGGLNRKGILCAKCKSNYCTAVNSLKYKCIDNGSHKHYYSYTWIFYLLFEYVLITLLMIIVIIFNVSVTSGPANAFIFFSQIISSTFSVDADGQINYETITNLAPGIKQAYIFLYGIWNLDFLNAIDYDGWLFCLSPKFGALQIMTLKYIAAAYPLVIIVLIVFLVWLYNKNYRFVVCLFRPFHWCTARCMRYLNIDRSLMDALATFFILSYVKFAVTACYILYPNPLVYDSSKHAKYVAYLDGEVDYGSSGHIPYLLVSVVAVLWCILLPLILFFYSTRRCYTFLDKTRKFRWLEPGDLFYHFLNSFHHCFKDDRRYFAAFYFFLKLILIGTYALGFDWTKQYIYQQIVCTLAILLVGTLQPYREMKYNFLDMGMFSILAVVNVLSLYSRHQQAVDIPLSKITFYSQVILIFVPLVYFTLYSIYFIIRNVFRCRRRCNIGLDDDKNEDETFNNFMNDVEEENRLETNHYYGSISDDEDAGQQRRKENEALFIRPSPDSIQFRSRRGRTEPLRSRYMPRQT